MRFYFGILVIVSLAVWVAWRTWRILRQQPVRPVRQPLLWALVTVISLSWSFATTSWTYAGVAVSQNQLTQIKQLTAAEKVSVDALAARNRVTTVMAQTATVQTTAAQLDTAHASQLKRQAAAVVTQAKRANQVKPVASGYHQVNHQLAHQLGKTPKQVRAVFNQLQRDAGMSVANR
ncbi:hypothetical protein [Lactiplantibacillus songbeiensis]|uniref:Uncharacterized protein n=1 Tax=Lactiplantibacillus songbeiensis TaxID=2559920 RepID=A0ABW4C2A0_9LACO|nr:hypothetical protein [Lactiplantibacillus songbeiensis]